MSPQEQWDNLPAIGKLQIAVAIGMLESYGEGAGNPEGYVHYCNGSCCGVLFFACRASPRPFAGGLPGYFPPIAGRAGFGQVGFNLYDPFNWFDAAYPGKDKVRSQCVQIRRDVVFTTASDLLTD